MTVDIDTTLWPETCHGRWMSEEYEPGLVSVIIPTYNRAHFLVEAMDSVWSQTYRPIELIVVADGSSAGHCNGENNGSSVEQTDYDWPDMLSRGHSPTRSMGECDESDV